MQKLQPIISEKIESLCFSCNFRIQVYFLLIISCFLSSSLLGQNGKGFAFKEDKEKKEVKVLYNGNLLTAYCYYDSVMKPVLFPVNTVDGIPVTRGFPLAPRAGERTDHPHHIGIWMNYESVNGLDFWNNSTSIPAENRYRYGTIKHIAVATGKERKARATLMSDAGWHRPDGKKILHEHSEYKFSIVDNKFIIDRKSKLTALDEEVIFKDVKDGFFAIRVARELEHPSQQKDIFVDAQGNKTDVPKMNNEGVTGMYTSSNGRTGDSVWSTKAEWVKLTGTKEGKKITVAIFDHPKNPGYPAYWHARGYGLFAVNPLGKNVFSNGKEVFNMTLSAGSSVTFQYRVVIASGEDISSAEMNKLFKDFKR